MGFYELIFETCGHLCHQMSERSFFIEYDYLDINNAMRLVTKWNKGENAFVTIDKWTPYKISFLFEDQVPPNS